MTFYQRTAYALAPWARKLGKAIENFGIVIEGPTAYSERLKPSSRVLSHKSTKPKISADCFIASSATLIGNVEVGEASSIWYGAVVRGDVHYVKIGARSSVGDGTVIHVAKFAGDFPTIIGDEVVIGPRSVVHACTLEDGCYIGAGSIILDGAKISKGAVLAAGSLAPPGCVVPAGQIWAGFPAKYVRNVTHEESVDQLSALVENVRLAVFHAEEANKTVDEIEFNRLERDDAFHRDPDLYHTPVKRFGQLPDEDDVLGFGPPGLIFHNKLKPNPDEMSELIGEGSGVESLRRAKEARGKKILEQARLTEKYE